MKKTHQYGVMLVLVGATLWGSSSNSLEYLMTYQHFSWDTVLAIRMVVTAAVFLLISGLRGEKLWNLSKGFFEAPSLYGPGSLYHAGSFYDCHPLQQCSNRNGPAVSHARYPAGLLPYFGTTASSSAGSSGRFPCHCRNLPHCDKRGGSSACHLSGSPFLGHPERLWYGILYGFRRRSPAPLSDLSDYRLGSLGNALLLMALNHPTLEGTLWTAGTLAAFGIIIVLGTLIAYTVYLESTKYIPASETGALAAFEPLSAYAVSILFMGNRVGFVEMAGALCIMVMVWMLSKKA